MKNVSKKVLVRVSTGVVVGAKETVSVQKAEVSSVCGAAKVVVRTPKKREYIAKDVAESLSRLNKRVADKKQAGEFVRLLPSGGASKLKPMAKKLRIV